MEKLVKVLDAIDFSCSIIYNKHVKANTTDEAFKFYCGKNLKTQMKFLTGKTAGASTVEFRMTRMALQLGLAVDVVVDEDNWIWTLGEP